MAGNWRGDVMRRILLATFAALFATLAHAEGINRAPRIAAPAEAQQAPAAPSWHQTGFYGAVQGAYDVARLEAGGFDANDGNLAAGGAVGFKYRMPGNLVLGAEADFMFTNVKAERTINGLTIMASPRHVATARAVAGYAMGPALFYVTGGAAWQNLEIEAVGLGSETEWQRGLAYGGGIALELTSTLGIRGELLRYDFSRDGVDTTQDMFRVGAVIKLN